ncbi:MAG: sugar ABC transporter permease [Oscillospiraceae bacterium]|nr:sugar ABC transporter permease [Oscillospiraceae bacterium]
MRSRKRINLFYIPVLILFGVFVVYPFIDGIRISFTNWNGFLPTYNYIGLTNYINMVSDQWFHNVFRNTIIYGFGSTIIQQIIGLSMALFLDSKFKARGLVRTISYLPIMIAPLIMGYIIFFIVQFRGGALNDLVGLFGMDRLDWVGVPNRAVTVILLVNSLQYMGVSMVIYLAGLQNIPNMYKEAASVDGIGPWNTFWHITLPLLAPALSASVVINLIGGLKLFDIIRALSPAAPSSGTHSLVTFLTYQYFNIEQAGYSAAIGVVTFAFILIVSIVVIKLLDKMEVVL